MKQALEIDDLHELAELLTAAEAADYLRISVWTLRHWVSDKKIRFLKIGKLCGSRRPMSTASCRIMLTERR
jgi:excisionase family DNA binding protein